MNNKTIGYLLTAFLSFAVSAGAGPEPPKQALSPNVRELKFTEIIERPIGPRGMALSQKARGLEGRAVRISGYMIQQEQPVPGMFLLAPAPMILHEDEYGFCEDLPPVIVHVSVGDGPKKATISHVSGPLLLTGILHLGNRGEPDGRISTVRLQLQSAASPDGSPLQLGSQGQIGSSPAKFSREHVRQEPFFARKNQIQKPSNTKTPN